MTITDPVRTRRYDIKAIRMKKNFVDLSPHQYWCETRHALEIWQTIEGQACLIKRIPRKDIITIIKTKGAK